MGALTRRALLAGVALMPGSSFAQTSAPLTPSSILFGRATGRR